MNAFADWLFSLLFGWMGGAANRAWNAIVNSSGGISSFFSRYWLIFLLIALIAGTVLDYAVWLVRWRPYLVWRSWLTRTLRRRRVQRSAQALERADMDENARGALAEWVAASDDSSPISYDPALYQQPYDPASSYAPEGSADYPADAYSATNEAQPYMASSDAQASYVPEAYAWLQGDALYQRPPEYAPLPEQPYASSTEGYGQDPRQPAETLWQPQPGNEAPYMDASQEEQYSPLSGYQNQPLIDYAQPAMQPYDPALYGDGQNPETVPADPAYPQNVAVPRRRRSGRKQRPAARKLLDDFRQRIGQREDEEGMLDGLPPAVRPEDAFHEAVYPSGYRYQTPDYDDTNGQQQQ